MDSNAHFYEKQHGTKPDYGNQIGKAIVLRQDNGTVRFFEMTPVQQDIVWIERMRANSCLRSNVTDSGPMNRSKISSVTEQLQKLAV